jgi:Tol biopolymer transport system component
MLRPIRLRWLPFVALLSLISACTDRVVVPVSVDEVRVNAARITLEVGQGGQLAASVHGRGRELSGRSVSWTSQNLNVVQVNGTGVVQGVSPGTTMVVASSEGQSAEVEISVVPAAVATVEVSPPAASVVIGTTRQLSATLKDTRGATLTDRTISWSSDSALVATVSATGLVTGVATGTARITATSEGQSATAQITVIVAPVATITIAPSPGSVQVDATLQLTATLRDSGGNELTGRTVTWSSPNDAVATVSASGLVTGVSPGSVRISASSEGRSAEAQVTVSQVPVATVHVQPPTGSLEVGDTLHLRAVTRSASGAELTGRLVTWSSDQPSVATVSGHGVVRGVGAGTARITASSEGRTSAPSTIEVQMPLELAFWGNRDGNYEIYTLSADGTREARLTNHSSDDQIPVWSPDGSRIAFITYRDGSHAALYVMNADGTGLTRLTTDAFDYVYDHQWMPDGHSLVFVANGQIYIIGAGGGGLRQLTHSASNSYAPRPSHDGSRIVFNRFSTTTDVYVINADGSGELRLTDGSYNAYTPRWSPDDHRVVYTGSTGGPAQIYVMDANGANQTALTHNGAHNWDPQWSPDGSRIMFINDIHRTANAIFLINADGTGERQLTADFINQSGATWSPDGERIAYTDGATSFSTEVYVINADGTMRSRLTNNVGYEFDVKWRP